MVPEGNAGADAPKPEVKPGGLQSKKRRTTYVKTKNKVVDPTRRVAAVDTGMYLVGLNLFPALLGIL